jgi:Helitron helicase-like domain at N-terminus
MFRRYHLYRRSPLQIQLACGALTQMYITDTYVRVRSNDLHYIRSRMPQNLMVSSRRHLVNLLDRVAQEKGYEVGRSFVLPTTFRGGEDYMERLYRHCIATLRVLGAT